MSIDPTFKKPFSPPSPTPQNDGDKLARLVNWTLDVRPASDGRCFFTTTTTRWTTSATYCSKVWKEERGLTSFNQILIMAIFT